VRIPLDHQAEAPLYRQIESYLRKAILAGSLAPDTRLPASRKLAEDLGVNRITVETAYECLEADGLLSSRVGSGTYVLAPETLPVTAPDGGNVAWPLWQQSLPKPVADDKRGAARHPDPISFAGGVSDARLYPADEFRRVLQSVMRRDGITALDYGERNGYAPLRATIAHVLASQGLQARPESVLVTAGSQQAISLVAQLLLGAGDTILVESPTYSGALDLFRALGFTVVGVPVDEQGMQVDLLERLLQQHHPRLVYTIPNFHNPTGTCLAGARRRQLITLADRYNVPILEYDFVGDLRYDGRTQPALKALDPGGRVIYVSTFSKMLMPGLRVGFLLADGPVYDSLVRFKRVNDLATSTLVQRALESYVTVGRYQAHLHRSCQVFRKRRDAMVSAIEAHLPADVHCSPPQGGLFAWLQLPDGLSSDDLAAYAAEEGVEFVPGSAFYVEGREGTDKLRLNFVVQPPDRIDEGIRRLARALERMRGRK